MAASGCIHKHRSIACYFRLYLDVDGIWNGMLLLVGPCAQGIQCFAFHGMENKKKKKKEKVKKKCFAWWGQKVEIRSLMLDVYNNNRRIIFLSSRVVSSRGNKTNKRVGCATSIIIYIYKLMMGLPDAKQYILVLECWALSFTIVVVSESKGISTPSTVVLFGAPVCLLIDLVLAGAAVHCCSMDEDASSGMLGQDIYIFTYHSILRCIHIRKT